jgi:hypothetical protein
MTSVTVDDHGMKGGGWLRWFAIVVGVLVVLFLVQRLVNPGDDESRIEAVIERASTSTDADYCDEDLTDLYLETTTGGEAPYADELCEIDAEIPGADSVEVSNVQVDGDVATASVEQMGGSFDGSTLIKELVKEDGDWKLNRILGFAGFDRERFDRAYREDYQAFGSSPRVIDCAMTRLARISDEEVQRMVLRKDAGEFPEIVVECDRAGIVSVYVDVYRDPEYDDFPPESIRCAENRIRRASDAELVRLEADLIAFQRVLFDCDPDSFLAYARDGLSDDRLDADEAECVVDELRALPPDEAIRLGYDDGQYNALVEVCD